jgi:anti-anti-sigma regulatory factor
MPLKISKNKSVYHLKGKVKTPDVASFLTYFSEKIDKKKKITLNIDEAEEIDRNGLNAIQQLMILATSKEKKFSIVGDGCKEIYDHFFINQLN